MSSEEHWILPDGVEETLPPDALHLEVLCRKLLDLHILWGYELVIPPWVEYVDSLLTGTGQDLDLKTLKVTDRNGRLLGIRSDITPQVARIDACVLRRDIPTRLCYLGSVLHAQSDYSGGSRTPLQIGAELYGYQRKAADIEILSLMLETLKCAGITDLHLDIGHAGIFQHLLVYIGVNPPSIDTLLNIFSNKAYSDLERFLEQGELTEKSNNLLRSFIRLNGGAEILDKAVHTLHGSGDKILHDLNELTEIITSLKRKYSDITFNVDLSELRGYQYHTGIIFTAYTPGCGKGIAFGGRYDAIGESFGRSRPATGFSVDVKALFPLVPRPKNDEPIFAPVSTRPEFIQQVTLLRSKGEVVVCELPDQKGDAKDMGCTRILVYQDRSWQLIPLS